MEYLSGETLVYMTRSLRARGEVVPPAITCRIAAEVAAGLDCAHNATDPAGNPQPIVHRDVTPSNLIVCFNGVVKIVDFGVAKATLHEGQTRGGVKGKMSYLAPEQLYDQPIDGRTDVFQLGITLHELLTGHRLFKGGSDHQRAMAVLEQRIARPSELVPDLPKVLDDVVLWALERDPARRPATADDFRRALEGAANEIGSVSGHDLGVWMKKALAERLTERTQFERQCVAEMREGRSASGEGPAVVAAASHLAEVRPLPVSSSRMALSPAPDDGDSRSKSVYPNYQPASSSSAVPPTAINARRATLGLVGLGVLLAAGVAIAWRLGSASEQAATAATEAGAGSEAPAPPAVQSPPPAGAPTARSTFDVAVTVVPAHAVIELDGVAVGTGTYRATLPIDGTRHILTVRADGYEAVGLDFADQPPPPRVELDPVRAPERRPAARPARRTPPAPERRAPRPRAPEEEPAVTDNPDPWAETGESER